MHRHVTILLARSSSSPHPSQTSSLLRLLNRRQLDKHLRHPHRQRHPSKLARAMEGFFWKELPTGYIVEVCPPPLRDVRCAPSTVPDEDGDGEGLQDGANMDQEEVAPVATRPRALQAPAPKLGLATPAPTPTLTPTGPRARQANKRTTPNASSSALATATASSSSPSPFTPAQLHTIIHAVPRGRPPTRDPHKKARYDVARLWRAAALAQIELDAGVFADVGEEEGKEEGEGKGEGKAAWDPSAPAPRRRGAGTRA